MDRDYFRNDRPEMLPLIPARRERILEIGCGEGKFSTSIAGAGETWGIEPDKPSADIAATRLSRVFHATFESARDNLPLGAFDVIICNDVIEHMDDHDRFFAEILPFLAPNGVLVGSVPNVRYFGNLFDLLIVKDWHYKDSGVLDRTHKRFFTLKSLGRSLVEAGFQVNALHGINSKLSIDLSGIKARYHLFGFALIGLSGGYWSDARFMQLAFSASRRP